MPEPEIRQLNSIHDITEADWTRFSGTGNPFLRHSFFRALEDSGCAHPATGWTPAHLAFYLGHKLAGLAPAYLKTHSRGEYVFDWAWAEAYQRYGLAYYPKLLLAIPFTPSQGPRLLLADHLREQLAPVTLHRLLAEAASGAGAHSWHLLFPDQRDQQLLETPGQLHRLGCQFHWKNHDYQCFGDFLARLTSRKRKSIRKERSQVRDQGISFRHYPGGELPDRSLETFYRFYQATYFKHGQRPYLNASFFRTLRDQQPEQLHLIMAERAGEPIAGALFLKGDEALYGRYWGCLEDYAHLHFETCYYQGIELAIELGLSRFDAGAQGEHKLIRGFEPVLTHSWHWLAETGFRQAIEDFSRKEARQVLAYQRAAQQALPFRADQGTGGPSAAAANHNRG